VRGLVQQESSRIAIPFAQSNMSSTESDRILSPGAACVAEAVGAGSWIRRTAKPASNTPSEPVFKGRVVRRSRELVLPILPKRNLIGPRSKIDPIQSHGLLLTRP